jgi:hypothetical protein
MNEIYQGDNGTVLSLTITNDESVVDLTNSTVEVVIKYKKNGIKKQAIISDAINGKCQITLTAGDVNYEGIYSLQATVTFSNGNTFTSNVHRFVVNKKVGYIPVIGGSTGNIGDSSINGNIIVNGQEIQVYDDAQVRTDINNLLNSQHTHSNKSSLDRLGINEQNKLTIDGIELPTGGGNGGGSSVSDSTTNGNILVNGIELQVYDDSSIRSQLHSHTNKSTLDKLTDDGTNLLFNGTAITISNSETLNRFGISANGRLTIDGVEQVLEDPTSPIDGGTFTTTYNTTIVDGGEF